MSQKIRAAVYAVAMIGAMMLLLGVGVLAVLHVAAPLTAMLLVGTTLFAVAIVADLLAPDEDKPETESRWLSVFNDGADHLEHLDGVAWHAAPAPRRLHRHQVQTRGVMSGLPIERCACGAFGPAPWERIEGRERRVRPFWTSRRRTRRRAIAQDSGCPS